MRDLLIVDDHPLFGSGLAQVLSARRPNTRFLFAPSAEEGRRLLRESAALDLVIIDVLLPGSDGFAALSDYAALRAEVPRVLMSGADDPGFAFRARRLGAAGFFPKTLPPEAIVAGVGNILNGGEFFPTLHPGTVRDVDAPPRLTRRELEVLTLLAEGCSNRDIAARLGVTERTAKAHVSGLMHALGGLNRTQTLVRAQLAGLVPRTR